MSNVQNLTQSNLDIEVRHLSINLPTFLSMYLSSLLLIQCNTVSSKCPRLMHIQHGKPIAISLQTVKMLSEILYLIPLWKITLHIKMVLVV